MSGYSYRPEEWPWSAPPEVPPPSLADALATPLRDFMGCWIEGRCRGCGNLKAHPIRTLLMELQERADMPLGRAVSALLRCEKCGRGRDLALISHLRWRESWAAGKPPNWSMMLSGPQRGTVAVAKRPPP